MYYQFHALSSKVLAGIEATILARLSAELKSKLTSFNSLLGNPLEGHTGRGISEGRMITSQPIRRNTLPAGMENCGSHLIRC